MFVRRALLAALAAASLCLSGCGYHIAGKGGGKMPGGVTALSIPMFENSTSKPDIESFITSAFVQEFVATINVTEGGDTVMHGVIKDYRLDPISYAKSDVSQEYRITVRMALRITRGSSVIWEDNDIAEDENFKVNTGDVTATKDAELTALKKLSRDTARLVKERMLEDF